MSKIYFDSHPGYTRIGYKSLNKAKEKFPIGTALIKYVPMEFAESLATAREIYEKDFFIPEKMWSYKILKPNEILEEVAEIQIIDRISGYYLDENGTYWPVAQNKENHNLNFVFVLIEEKEFYQ